MKKYFFTIVLLLAAMNIFAQDSQEIVKQIKSKNEAVTSIQGDLKRIKKMPMINNDIVAEGLLFYFDGKMSLRYSKPVESFIINGDQLLLAAASKKHIFSTNNNADYQELSSVLINAMKGDVDAILKQTNGNMEYASDSDNHIFTMVKNERPKKGFYKMTVKYAKSDCTINEIVLFDTSEVSTAYAISNKKLNTNIDVDEFTIE